MAKVSVAEQPNEDGRFWVVLRGDGVSGGRLVMHPSESDAVSEATRLTQQDSRTFYVLKATHRVEVAHPPVEVTEI